MTTSPTPVATIHARASLQVRALIFARATWPTERTPSGHFGFRPQKGTWHAYVDRGAKAAGILPTILPVLACPSCGGLLWLSPSEAAAKALRRMTGAPVPVAHQIDPMGRVAPDLRCQHGRCDFHRKVYLDRWNKTKPLYATAYVNLDKGEHGEIEIAYSHAMTPREARMHLGAGNYRVLGSGRAVGFFVDEKTGRVTAD